MNEELPPIAKINKFEIREQDGIDAGQAARFTTVLQLSEVLYKLAAVLGEINLEVILSQKGTEQDLKVKASIEDTCKAWLSAYQSCRDHMEKCHAVMEAELAMRKNLLYFYNQAAKLPSDSELEHRAKNLLTLLNQLEQHRKSGLMEIISKL